MGLTAITIENFKGIGAPVTVPLRPLTMLFGANSAGKSTVLQALQYAREVLEEGHADIDRTQAGGDAVDLGSFHNLVHGHDLERTIRIKLSFWGELSTNAFPIRYPNVLSLLGPDFEGSDDPWLEHAFTELLNIDQFAVAIAVAWDSTSDRAWVVEYVVEIDGVLWGKIEKRLGDSSRLIFNPDHPLFNSEGRKKYTKPGHEPIVSALFDLFDGIFDNAFEYPPVESVHEVLKGMSKEQKQTALQNYRDMLEMDQHTLMLEYLYSRSKILTDRVVPNWGSPLPIIYEDSFANYRNEVRDLLISNLHVGAGESVLKALRGIRYLGPLRNIPPRNFAAQANPGPSRWANGLGAWDALWRRSAGDKLLEKCAKYLGETLGLRYTLRRGKAGESPHARDQLMIRDERNGADVSPMDIGVGVSQVIPVVVGAAEPNCTVFAVEQPELHIHPAIQVNLADIFLRELLGPREDPQAERRTFLIETHSEHIILRVMRRMRETCEGTLPEGFPGVKPEDVAVLYVEVVDGQTVIREMPLNERGELVKAWPGGFFEEGLRETF